MCPDYELLSAFIDGEVENPWKGEIERHLEVCTTCREKVVLYRRMSVLLEEDKEPDFRSSMTRVQVAIESASRTAKKIVVPFWKRRILIPVPIAAVAATVLILIGTVFTVTTASNKAVRNNSNNAVITERPVANQDDELATIIKLMENKDFNNEVIIQLPEGSNFSMWGEPKILRAKDLKRSN